MKKDGGNTDYRKALEEAEKGGKVGTMAYASTLSAYRREAVRKIAEGNIEQAHSMYNKGYITGVYKEILDKLNGIIIEVM